MLRPYDIVKSLNSESRFYHRQGIVEAIQYNLWDTPDVFVKFERDIGSHHFSTNEIIDDFCVIFKEHELERNNDWMPEIYANRFFKDRWHSIHTLCTPLDCTKLCMVMNCTEKQVGQIWINIWGSVCNAYVCEVHIKHYKKFSEMDSFPWRKNN